MGSSKRGGPLPRRGFSCAVYLQEPRAWYFGLVWWHLVLPLMLLSTGGPGDPTCPCINATALLIGLSSLSVIPNRTDVTDFHSNLVPTDLQIG